jgi:hypothetical protein
MPDDEFSVSDWCVRQYHDVKGNLKTSVLYTVFGGMMTAFHFLVSGIPWWRHALIDFLFAISIIWVAVAMWELRAKKRMRSHSFAGSKLPTQPSSKLNIISAFYELDADHSEDVTERVKSLPREGIVISVDNNTMGCDPAPNMPPGKFLRVRYT